MNKYTHTHPNTNKYTRKQGNKSIGYNAKTQLNQIPTEVKMMDLARLKNKQFT